MNYKSRRYVDESQNICTELTMVETPEEYLQRAGEVYAFAQSMKLHKKPIEFIANETISPTKIRIREYAPLLPASLETNDRTDYIVTDRGNES